MYMSPTRKYIPKAGIRSIPYMHMQGSWTGPYFSRECYNASYHSDAVHSLYLTTSLIWFEYIQVILSHRKAAVTIFFNISYIGVGYTYNRVRGVPFLCMYGNVYVPNKKHRHASIAVCYACIVMKSPHPRSIRHTRKRMRYRSTGCVLTFMYCNRYVTIKQCLTVNLIYRGVLSPYG